MTFLLKSRSFEPRTTRQEEVDALVGVLAAVIEGKRCVYVSAPITSGKLFSEWRPTVATSLANTDPKYQSAHNQNVIQPNKARARELVARLRNTIAHEVVIDPTAAPDFDGWSQDDYRLFWAAVIARYARLVVFVDGWEYSNGCSYEFLTACRLRLPLMTESEQPLTVNTGIELLRSSCAGLTSSGHDTAFLSWILRECARYMTPDLARSK